MRYVVYEVWTKARIVEAETDQDAYKIGEPEPMTGLSLCNWHIQAVPDVLPKFTKAQPVTGALKNTR